MNYYGSPMQLLPNLEAEPSGAVFSVDRQHRYLLWRRIADGEKTLLVVGLNPSTADELSNDATIRRCIGFAQDWNFSRLLVANLFAYRATRPEDLRRAEDPVGPENDRWLKAATEMAHLTLAAWGNNGLWLERHEAVVKLLHDSHCLGRTRRGAPRHPLYVKRSQYPIRLETRENG